MKIPEPNHSITALIDKHHEAQAEPPRPHMGASQLGHPCDRWLWLSFRWAVIPQHPGRILRLFRRGQNEEATVVADLRAIGMDIRSTGAKQARIDLGCHVSGSLDGIIESGVPEAPGKRHILEIKTHSRKSFDDLEKNGVEKSKPMHFVQMQIYMHGSKIDRALYVSICKDDDRIYTERVRYDKQTAQKYIDRGHRLALDERLPPPISTDPSWHQCAYCDGREFCHTTRTTKEVNCRTCAHVTPLASGEWRCERHNADGIPVDYQRTGCECHVLHPDLVVWPMQEGRDQWTAVYIIDGKAVANGEPDATVFASSEILANPTACANPDEFIRAVREEMGGRIEG